MTNMSAIYNSVELHTNLLWMQCDRFLENIVTLCYEVFKLRIDPTGGLKDRCMKKNNKDW